MKHPKGFWKNPENIKNEAKKYSSRTDFKKGSQCAYNAARELNLLDDMPWLKNTKKLPIGYWKVKEHVIEEGMKYKTKEDFQKGCISAFLAAHRYGYIDEMTWMVKQKQHKNGFWVYKTIEAEALKYQTKTEFKKKSPSAYMHALKLGIIDDFFINNYIEY